jgi:hypothetical protein
METLWYSHPELLPSFLNNLSYSDNMPTHNMTVVTFPHMRDLQLLNVSSRNFNSINSHFSLSLKEALERVSIQRTIKKETENLKSLTIGTCQQKMRHISIYRMKHRTHYIILCIFMLLHCAYIQSLSSPLHSHTPSAMLRCYDATEISRTSFIRD